MGSRGPCVVIGIPLEGVNEIRKERKTKPKIHWTFEILRRIEKLAYELALPPNL